MVCQNILSVKKSSVVSPLNPFQTTIIEEKVYKPCDQNLTPPLFFMLVIEWLNLREKLYYKEILPHILPASWCVGLEFFPNEGLPPIAAFLGEDIHRICCFLTMLYRIGYVTHAYHVFQYYCMIMANKPKGKRHKWQTSNEIELMKDFLVNERVKNILSSKQE
jgi:hypothetical protein